LQTYVYNSQCLLIWEKIVIQVFITYNLEG